MKNFKLNVVSVWILGLVLIAKFQIVYSQTNEFSEIQLQLKERFNTVSLRFDLSGPKEEAEYLFKKVNVFIDSARLDKIAVIRINNLPRGNFSFKTEKNYLNKSISGFYGVRFNQLTPPDKSIVIKVCSYLKNEPTVKEALAIFEKQAQDPKIIEFIRNPKRLTEITSMASFCYKEANKVFVKDVQSHLQALGYSPGPIDGKYGKKTENALKNFYSENSLEWNGTVRTNEFFLMRELIEGKKPYLFHGNPGFHQYFGKTQGIKGNPPTLADKLKSRKTINAFTAWNTQQGKPGYGLVYNHTPRYGKSKLTLVALDWNYIAVGTKWGHYKGVDKFLTGKRFNQGLDIYGTKIVTQINNPEFQKFIVKVARREISKYRADGVFLDWWDDNQQQGTGYTPNQIKQARINLLKKLRKELGDEKVIMANVNWLKDHTVRQLSGANFELFKDVPVSGRARLYHSAELWRIENVLSFYEKNLRYPKILTPIFMRKTKELSNKDRNTKENRKMAKLLTAMTTVIATNGYILYGDNTGDSAKEDFNHILYDFYSFNIGKPTSGRIKVFNGVGLKEHKLGFIAYNITSREHTLKRPNGEATIIKPYSGLFCKEVGKRKCLSID